MTRAVLTAVALASLLPATSAAQTASQAAASLHIDAFRGFPWGTAMGELIDSLGAPAQADTLEEGMIVLVYRDTFADTETIAMYGVLGEEGLVKGQHAIPFAEEGNCEAEFLRLRNQVLLKYPMIVPEDRSRNDSEKAFCAAVLDGDAAWISTWTDPDTGARAMVVIDPGRPKFNVVFESARFLAWIEEQEQLSEP